MKPVASEPGTMILDPAPAPILNPAPAPAHLYTPEVISPRTSVPRPPVTPLPRASTSTEVSEATQRHQRHRSSMSSGYTTATESTHKEPSKRFSGFESPEIQEVFISSEKEKMDQDDAQTIRQGDLEAARCASPVDEADILHDPDEVVVPWVAILASFIVGLFAYSCVGGNAKKVSIKSILILSRIK